MTTLIFVDQENSDLPAPKSQRKLPSGSSKVLAERKQVNTPLPKKSINASPVAYSVRKALGNVNKIEGVTSKVDKLNQKNQPCTVNKTGLESCDTVAEEDLPEIENMFPMDPQDFEYFELLEDEKLSSINLCDAALMGFKRTRDRCESMASLPMEIEDTSWESIKWESNLLPSAADILATLDEIIDMPPPIDDD